ncbi:MAG: hypothetical protein ACFUZC_19080 [Chthoniobacteraceae bacterium]
MPQSIQLLAIWIFLCAYLNVAGWVLSAFHALDFRGYLITLLLGTVGVVAFFVKYGRPLKPVRWNHLKWRYRHALPLCFLVLAILIFLGGALYAPCNYDALSYRIPRICHWLDQHGWHWIDAAGVRMNTRATGFEWIMAPLLALTGSVRLIFLINFSAFLFLPGLIFQTLRFLGVRQRVAWNWMWVLPTAYIYALQAGSAGNDAIAATYFLASIGFAFKARASGKLAPLFVSMLAIALVTGSKTSNAPLALPWLVAVWPALRLLWKQKLLASLCIVLAAGASFLPTAVLNYRQCKDWTGLSLESTYFKNLGHAALIGNTIQLASQNLIPPLFPKPKELEHAIVQSIPEPLRSKLKAGFEGHFDLSLGELQIEEFAGIGFGIGILSLFAFGYSCATRREYAGQANLCRTNRDALLMAIATWIAFAVLLDKSYISVFSRVSAAYYPLLFLPLLGAASAERLVRTKAWKSIAVFAACTSMFVVIVTPARPLWPAQTVLAALESHFSNGLTQRALSVYQVYRLRPQALWPALQQIPAGVDTVGFVSTGDDVEGSLWLPYGKLHLRNISLKTPLENRDFEYVLIVPLGLSLRWNMTMEQWLACYQAEVVATPKVHLKIARGDETLYLVKFTKGKNRE